MPRSYGGYVDPQEMQQMYGGNEFYNPLMSTPDWGAGIRSTLNSMWAYKQQKQKEDEERRKAEAVAAQEQREWDLTQRKTLADIAYTESQTAENKRQGLTPPPVNRVGLKQAMMGMGVPKEQADTIDALSDADLVKVKDKFLGRYGEAPPKPEKPDKPDKPTEHDKKLAYWGAKLQKGEINQAQFEEYVWGGKPSGPTEKPLSATAPARQANLAFVSSWHKTADIKVAQTVTGLDAKWVRKIIESQGGERPVSPDGIFLDAPRTYSVAKFNMADGVSTPQDTKVVQSIDAMLDVFKERIQPNYPTFDAFMKATDPFATALKKDKDFNINLLKEWYEIYRRR
jgi:hypothetical protein